MKSADSNPVIDDRFLDHPYALAGRVIDPVPGTMVWNGEMSHIRRKELEVLALLASSDGAPVTRQAFINTIWAGNDLVGERGVNNTIFSLRRALQDNDAQHPLIRTIPRRGYQLTVAVQQPLAMVADAFMPGVTIVGNDGWRLLKLLGKSAHNESWLAEPSEFGDQDNARRVFRFCRSEAHRRRLQREITLLRYVSQRLAERNDIVFIRDWQLDEPPYYLARDYLRFGNLAEWALAQGGLPQEADVKLKLMLSLAQAMAALHSVGVVHRQFDADCVLVEQTEAGPQLKIGAFGVGQLQDRSQLAPLNITAAGLTQGVEDQSILANAANAAEDVCALGKVLLQLALADVNAQANDVRLVDLEASLQNLLRACIGPTDARPTAAALALQLQAMLEPESPLGAVIPATQAPESAPANASSAPNRISVPPALLGSAEQIGNYRLLDKLGEGGMGTVYLAEQREPVQRQVALKLIKAGMDTAQVLARFEAERQALALMNHVNVAAVFEAGSSAAGRPYFAMEYVAGLEITAHCDQRELDFRSRIELFLQACDGVLHAHQKGIIHRDLKPSNILIKSVQGQLATAKIIDFGVAKSLQRKLSHLTAHTQIGSYVGTPVYSSPEQISGSAMDVDTRADIYSLGVVLFELLAGVTPYNAEMLASKSPVELTKMLSNEEPPPLLKRFVSLEAKLEVEIAERRKISVVQMKQTLGSDLSWIVAKCLERDPNERYASVLELEKDLQRWLENRPVEARPITWTYRMRKMIRRNWGAVSIGGVVALALLITTTAAIVGFVRSERALESARLAAEEAEAAAEFQVKQLSSLNPAAMGNGLREFMHKAIEQSGKERRLDAAMISDAQKKMDEALFGVDFTDLTLDLLERYIFKTALETVNKDYAAHPALQARLWQSLADTLNGLDQPQLALAPQELALAQRQRLFGDKHPLYLASLGQRGALRTELDQLPQAEADLRQAVSQLRLKLGERDPITLVAINSLAWLVINQGDFDQAEKLYNEVLAGRRLGLGAEHPLTLRVTAVLGQLKLRQGNLVAAQALLEDALKSQSRVLGKDHLETLKTMSALASVYQKLNKVESAELYYRQSVAGIRKLLGSEDFSTLMATNNFASFLVSQGQFKQAEELLREIVAIQQRSSPESPEVVAKINLAQIFMETGRLREADMTLLEAIESARTRLGNEHPYVQGARNVLAILRREQGRFAEAEALYREQSEIWQRIAGTDYTDGLVALDGLATALQLQGQFAQAQTVQNQALTGLRKVLGMDSVYTLSAESHLASLLHRQGKLSEAAAHFRKTLAALRRIEVPEKIATLDCMLAFSRLLREQGELPEALALAREAAESARRVLHKRDHRVGVFLIEYGKVLVASGLLQEAEPILVEAWNRLSAVEGANPTYSKEVVESFIALYEAMDRAEPGRRFDVELVRWRSELAARVP